MISLETIKDASSRIKGFVHRTSLIRSSTLSAISGYEVYLKPENLQKTGSFKIRGATNFILQMSDEQLKCGVITGSSGNHGQAVAFAAKTAGCPAVVVVPEDASRAKVAAIRDYGAEVVMFGRASNERIAKAKEIAQNREMTFIPPFDDYRIMSGQGTIGLEIMEDLPDVDAVLVPAGGGGLISGIATAVKEKKSSVGVYGVESEKSNSTYLSLKAGHLVELKDIVSVADGIRTTTPGVKPFEVERRYLDDVLLVPEDEIKKAVLWLLERCKLLVEPSGAVTIAALMCFRLNIAKGCKVVAVMSGGNVDLSLIAGLIKEIKK